MNARLFVLLLGNFAIGTGAMVVPGMLNELAHDLRVTPAAIGLLVSGFALMVCVGGPVLAALTSGIARGRLLTFALSLYAAAHIAAAFAPGYDSLLVIRVVTAIGAALFTPQAAATVGLLVPPQERGAAIGTVFLGWSISAVVGVPLGAWLGAAIGWRWTIAAVGVLSGLIAFGVWRQIPAGLQVAPMDKTAWRALLRNWPLLLAVAVTAVQAGGQFTAFTYLALLYKEFIGASPQTISILYAVFGAAGVIGNLLATRMMDRLGAAKVALWAMGSMALALLFWPLTHGGLAITTALTFVWGLGCFAVNGTQQARLVGLAPPLASASVALNSSAIYLGQAFGALSGGALISAIGLPALSPFGTAFMLGAMVLSWQASRMAIKGAAAGAATARRSD